MRWSAEEGTLLRSNIDLLSFLVCACVCVLVYWCGCSWHKKKQKQSNYWHKWDPCRFEHKCVVIVSVYVAEREIIRRVRLKVKKLLFFFFFFFFSWNYTTANRELAQGQDWGCSSTTNPLTHTHTYTHPQNSAEPKIPSSWLCSCTLPTVNIGFFQLSAQSSLTLTKTKSS